MSRRKVGPLILLAASALVAAACSPTAPAGNGATTPTPTPSGSATPTPSGSSTPTPTPSGTPAFCDAGTNGGSVTKTGGTLDCLDFAVIGDSRPATIDDTSGSPYKTIVKQIYTDIQNETPRPKFAVATGDYMFASTSSTSSTTQLTDYLSAAGAFSNIVFHTMGNHECTGTTTSNCGSGNADGITNNYTAFMNKLITPLGQTKPYYSINVASTSGAWTAKFVFVAANAWSSAQGTWLDGVLAQPTTYTFIVRHEKSYDNTAPGVSPSGVIIANHPYTFFLEGHTHTMQLYSSSKELIVGNGGAPLTTTVDYGYAVARQRTDGAMRFEVYDYQSHAEMTGFTIKPDGSMTQ